MTGDLNIHTLGGLRVTVAGERAEGPRSRTAEALLVYLACQRRPMPREYLAELFWPNRPDETAQANLRGAIHRLRRVFSPYLLITRQGMGVNADLVVVDATEFEGLVAAGQLEKATRLYQGAFLDGFYLSDSPAFDDWAASERARFHDLAVAAVQALISRHIAEGQLDEALTLVRRLLTLEPYHEPAHRTLMRLLARCGRRQAALEYFDRCRRMFEDELKTGLEPATISLFEAISHGEVSSEDTVNVVTTTAPRYNFPPVSSPLLGRWVELEGLVSRLENPDCRLVTVTGPGGVGKTRLALQAALDAAPSFADGVCFVPLAGVTSDSAIVPSIIQSLSLTLPPSGVASAGLVAYLRDKQILLVLDNFEQLLSGSLLLSELLHSAPQLKLLVTSRERLALSEEWLMPLSGLRADEAAVALFVQSAERIAPEVDLSGEEATICEICSLVEGFPLAIELAASWAGVMRCGDIVREIQASLDFLHSSIRNVPERHRSVRSLFDASWSLLPQREQTVFMRLAVFRGGFTATEAMQVADATLLDLRALTEKSLIRTDGQSRFNLHELIRQYAAERLVASGEDEATARRHFEAYLALAEEGNRELFGVSQPDWLRRLEAEWDNFRAALTWTFVQADTRDTVRLVVALSWFWRQRAFEEADLLLDRALNLVGLKPYEQALLLYYQGHIAWMKSAWNDADAQLSESLVRWAELGLEDSHVAARTRCSLAMTYYMQGRSQEAYVLLERALSTFRKEDDPWWTAFVLGWLGKVEVVRGKRETAEAFLSECLESYRRLGNRWGLGLFLQSAADLHLESGNLVQARALAEEGIRLLREVGHKHALSAALWSLGNVAKAEGHIAAAQAHFEESLALYRELGLNDFAVQVEGELASLRKRLEPG
jgi:predicted ATPase/DNA-binding SARP family transcriptional activator